MNLLFVYGTLKSGFANHAALRGHPRLGEAITLQRFPLRVLTRYRIPWLSCRPGSGRTVTGELYALPHRAFRALDRLEGVHRPGWFYLGALHVRQDLGVARRLVRARVYFGRDLPWLERHRPRAMLRAFNLELDRAYRRAA